MLQNNTKEEILEKKFFNTFHSATSSIFVVVLKSINKILQKFPGGNPLFRQAAIPKSLKKLLKKKQKHWKAF